MKKTIAFLLIGLVSVFLIFYYLNPVHSPQPQETIEQDKRVSKETEKKEETFDPIATLYVTGLEHKIGAKLAGLLIEQQYEVRGIESDFTNQWVQESLAMGAVISQGDISNQELVNPTFEGVNAVLLFMSLTDNDIDGNKNIINASKNSGINHIIYITPLWTSLAGGYRESTPHMEVESYLRLEGPAYTILRPVFFMDELMAKEDVLTQGKILAPYAETFKKQYLTVNDLVYLVIESLKNPREWIGREINVAGDEMTMPGLARLLSKHYGQEVSYEQQSWEEWGMNKTKLEVQYNQWLTDTGYSVNINKLREQFPGLQAIESYLQGSGR